MIELIEVIRNDEAGNFFLRKIYVNPGKIVKMVGNLKLQSSLNEGKMPKDLDKRTEFTTISLDHGYGVEVVVIGSVTEVQNKILNERKILHG